MVQAFFGRRWDATAWDEALVIATPTGQRCVHCQESIVDADDGVLAGGQFEHTECHLRGVLGDIAHLEGRCGVCAGSHGGTPVERGEGRSIREDARATVQWLIDHGRGRWYCDCRGHCRCEVA